MNVYTKLKEGWGVRADQLVTVGQQINVQTKAGQVKVETVSKILWSGPDKYRPGVTVHLVAIAQRGRTNSFGNRNSYRAGVTAPHGRVCKYCGSRECEGAWGGLCEQD